VWLPALLQRRRIGSESRNASGNAVRTAPDEGTHHAERVTNRRLAGAFSQQLICRVLGMIASVLTVTVTTRYLGPANYGTLITAIVFVGVFASLTELGVGSVLVRRVTSGRGSLERLVRVNTGISVIYCLPLFAIAAVSGAIVYSDRREVVTMILIVSSGLILTTISSCFEPVFVAEVRFGAVALADLTSRVASLGVTLLLVDHRASLVWFAAVQVVPPAVVLVVQGVAARTIVDCAPVFSMREGWGLLRESLPQTAVLIIGVLYYNADGVILSLRSTADQVGVYGLAYTVALTASVMVKFFLSSTLSTMTALYSRNRAEFARFISRAIETMLFAALPIAVGGALVAGPVVELIGSKEFVRDGGPALALLFAAVALSFLTGVVSQALFAAHDQIFLMRLNVSTLAINIALNVILAPNHGAVGAGIALIATEAIGLVVAGWRLHRRIRYEIPWRFAMRLTIPLAACAGTAVAMSQLSVLVSIPVAAAGYLAVNLIIGPVKMPMIKTALSDQTRPIQSTNVRNAHDE
jgi:O-antigen/teichoic acid export membrane protein